MECKSFNFSQQWSVRVSLSTGDPAFAFWLASYWETIAVCEPCLWKICEADGARFASNNQEHREPKHRQLEQPKVQLPLNFQKTCGLLELWPPCK